MNDLAKFLALKFRDENEVAALNEHIARAEAEVAGAKARVKQAEQNKLDYLASVEKRAQAMAAEFAGKK